MRFLASIAALLGALCAKQTAYSQSVPYIIESTIFKDEFTILDTTKWIIEKSSVASDSVTVKNEKLLLNTYGGATVWFRHELAGNYLIRFKRKVIMDGGRNDRLSDCNQFWMASDPMPHRMFKRGGAFNEYDSIRMYYVGMGGNYNTTTRFRRYDGKGEKKIIGEYTDSLHLLQPNKEYLIEILVKDGISWFRVDGQTWFSYTDPEALTRGWFAFRSTRSRQEIDDIEIYDIR